MVREFLFGGLTLHSMEYELSHKDETTEIFLVIKGKSKNQLEVETLVESLKIVVNKVG